MDQERQMSYCDGALWWPWRGAFARRGKPPAAPATWRRRKAVAPGGKLARRALAGRAVHP